MGVHKFMYTDLTKLTNMFSTHLSSNGNWITQHHLLCICTPNSTPSQLKGGTLVVLHHNPKWFWKHILWYKATQPCYTSTIILQVCLHCRVITYLIQQHNTTHICTWIAEVGMDSEHSTPLSVVDSHQQMPYHLGQLQFPVSSVQGVIWLGNKRDFPQTMSSHQWCHDPAMQDMGYSTVIWTVPLTNRCTVRPLTGQWLSEGEGGEG